MQLRILPSKSPELDLEPYYMRSLGILDTWGVPIDRSLQRKILTLFRLNMRDFAHPFTPNPLTFTLY